MRKPGWLPSIAICDWVGCFPDDPAGSEAAGWSIVVSWRAWQLEICVGRTAAR